MKNHWLVAAGAATMIGTVSVNKALAQENLGKCTGINACKGQSACATSESSCAGQNTCKGKGWIKTNRGDCEKQGGQFKVLK